MVGAIILTAETYQQVKVIRVTRNKNNSILYIYILINV